MSLVICAVGVVRIVDTHPWDAGVVPAASATLPTHQAPQVVPARPEGAEPVSLSVPALGVDAPVVAVAVRPDGQLAVPDDPHVLGWWRDGAWPTARSGTVVIDGHVDTRKDGPGALFHIASVAPGAAVSLATPGGPATYVVQAVRHYPKAALPAEVFDTAGNPRLVLISCGGVFDHATRQYRDNVVVYAVPAAA